MLKDFAQLGRAIRSGGVARDQPKLQLGPLIGPFVQSILPRCAATLVNAAGSSVFWSLYLGEATPSKAYAILSTQAPLVSATIETLSEIGVSIPAPNGIGIFGRPIGETFKVQFGCNGIVSRVRVAGLEYLVQGSMGGTFMPQWSGAPGSNLSCLRIQSQRPDDYIEISVLSDGTIKATVSAGGRTLTTELSYKWASGSLVRMELDWDFLADRPQDAMQLWVGGSQDLEDGGVGFRLADDGGPGVQTSTPDNPDDLQFSFPKQ